MLHSIVRLGRRVARRLFATPSARRSAAPALGCEPLEARDVPSTLYGSYNVDIIGRTAGGSWFAGGTNGSALTNSQVATWNGAVNWSFTQYADTNDDGLTDIISYEPYGGNWYAGYGTGDQLSTQLVGNWYPGAGWRDVQTADLNGDGKDELIGRTAGGQWNKATFTDAGFTTTPIGSWYEAIGWKSVQVADVNGDGKDDLIGRTNDGYWYAGVIGSNGAMTNVYLGSWYEGAGWADVRVGRVKAGFSGMGSFDNGQLDVLGYRTGTTVDVNYDSFVNQIGVTVRYTRPDGTQSTNTSYFYRPIVKSIVFQGGNGNDTFRTDLTATSIPVYAYGGLGNDDLEGGGGKEYLDGGEGDDILRSASYNSAEDVLDGGPGLNQYDRGFGLTGSQNFAANANAWAVNTSTNSDAAAADPNDIFQGHYGNCYFWAALYSAQKAGANLASSSRISYQGNNKYSVVLYKNTGTVETPHWSPDPQTVIFDWKTGGDLNQYAGDPSIDQNEPDFWHVLYWRAWNKVYKNVPYAAVGYTVEGDTYVGGEGGVSELVLPTLTGVNNSVSADIPPHSTTAQQTIIKNAILNGVANGYAMDTSTIGEMTTSGPTTSFKKVLDSKGQVVKGHQYSIYDATASYIYLRNPWGVDACGDYYDSRGDKNGFMDTTKEKADYQANGVFNQDDGIIQVAWVNYFNWFKDYCINPV